MFASVPLPHSPGMTTQTHIDRPPSLPYLATTRRARPPSRRPQSVSGYRVLVSVVFALVVAVNVWCEINLATLVGIVGPVSVLVWALTLLGSFGIGPIAVLWQALRS